MNNFTFLHVHTHFSLLGGPAAPADWCRAATAMGYKSIGIADRGPLAGIPAFARAAHEAGIQPVFGMEIDLVLPSDKDAKKQPTVLFARNGEGLENLAQIAALAYARWPQGEEAVAWQALAAHASGLVLVLLGGGTDGEASAFVDAVPDTQAEWGSKLRALFGEAAFVGLPHSGRVEDEALAAKVALAAGHMGIQLLATPVARYLRPEDAPAYRALRVARAHAGWKHNEPDSAAEPLDTHHLRPAGEAVRIFEAWPQALENVARVVQMCAGVDVLDLYLYTTGQAQGSAERARLQTIATERLSGLLDTESLPDDVQQRLSEELDALEKRNALPAWTALATMGHALWNLQGKQSPMPMGAPLGTADGSLLAYALGISPLNPLEHTAHAWLSAATDEKPPQILPSPGVEVPTNRRDAILAAITREYGPARTALAACPIDVDPLTAIWAAARTLGAPAEETRALALQSMTNGWEALAAEDSAVAKVALSLRDAPVTFKPDADMLLVAQAGKSLPAWLPVLPMEGAHAGGWVPWAEEAVARLHLPAITLRPSASLTLLDSALRIAAQYPVPGFAADELDLATCPNLADGATDHIIKGEVLGIPYFSASVVKGWKGEITQATAANMVARAMLDGKPLDAPKLDLWAEKTGDTEGVLLYSDQFEVLAHAAAGLSALETADLRRAVLGKDAEALAHTKAGFAEGCAKQGLDEESAEALWQALSGAATRLQSRYAATAWARVALWAAHLKAAHPAAFMAALLDDSIGRRLIPVSTLADEARRLGVAIKAPNAGYSQSAPSLERDGPEWAVLWGLALLPSWSGEVAARFVAARPHGGFAGMSDLARAAVEAGLSIEQLDSLVRSGGCDTLGGKTRSREGLLEMLPAWLEWAHRERDQHAAGNQLDMFAVNASAPHVAPDENSTLGGELSPRERYSRQLWERGNLGVGFTEAAEIEGLNKALEDSGDLRSRLLTSAQLADGHIGKSIYLVGLLTSIALVAPPPGENGGYMATAWVEDTEGAIELVAFPPNYKRHSELWTENNLVTITGRVSKHTDGALYLLCEHLTSFYGAVEEAEISVKVKQANKKAPAVGVAQASQARGPKLETMIAGVPASRLHATNSANGTSNGNYTGGAPMAAAAASSNPASPTMTTTSGEPANYTLTITLPITEDDQADIDRMIALKELLSEHAGADSVTLRIPCIPGTEDMHTAHLPRGVTYSTLLEAEIVSLLGPEAMIVAKLQ